jgi:prolyl-tRNA editing enzyme YbaK/EbsC (Cys-tRNA(Pro) deacylase)
MSLASVKEYFRQYGMEDRIVELQESSATVDLAAQALHCRPEEIAKTLAFMVGDKPVLIVTEGTAKIDNHKYKSFFHKKAKMMTPDQLLDLVGHEAGGVCPFGLKDGVDVYLDESLKKFEKLWPAAGSHNSAIEVSLEEMEKYSHYKAWIDVTKEVEA